MRSTIQSKQKQAGTVLIESAMTLLLLLMVLLGIMEAGRFFNVQQTLASAAREGARLSVAPITRTSTLATQPEIEQRVRQFLDAANISGATITVERPIVIDTGGVPTEFTRVRVEAAYQIITLSMFSDLQMNLKGEAVMRNETSP